MSEYENRDWSRLLQRALKDDVTSPDGTILLRRHLIGSVAICTGNLVACDPIFASLGYTPPLQQKVPKGLHQVSVSVSEDGRVAMAMIEFSRNKPKKWKLGIFDDPKSPDKEGFSVDSGLACYMDAHGAQSLEKRKNSDRWCDRLNAEIDENAERGWSFADIGISTGPYSNCVAFTSGLGDGTYESYFGYGLDLSPLCLVTWFFGV